MNLINPFEVINRYMETAPVDVVGLTKEFNISISYVYLGDDMSGTLEKNGDVYCISVNAADSITRQRFTIAHEFGHYIFHRNKIGDGIGDNRLYSSPTSGRFANRAIGKREDIIVNRFASTLLMPKDLIIGMWQSGITSTQEIASRLLVCHETFCRTLDSADNRNPSSLNMSRPTQVTAQ